jgi:prolyl oligopeptidase
MAPLFPRSASWTCCASTSSPSDGPGQSITDRPTIPTIYGSPDNPDDFKALRAYSPLHNIRAGTKYPPTLITTADHDDRVVSGHSFKYAAALQHAQEGPGPILIRIETKAGHGAGKPTAKIIEEAADRWAFLAKVLQMDSAL